jgi:hypothetical protein
MSGTASGGRTGSSSSGMNPEEVALLRKYADEATVTRSRVHKLADVVQVHEATIKEQNVLLTVLGNEVETLKQTVATKQHVQSGIDLLTLKIDHLGQTMDPIKRVVYGAVGVILLAVLVALVALVVIQQ